MNGEQTIRRRAWDERIADQLATALQRWRWLVVALFTVVLFATFVVKAQAKPFWLDEIYTILFAKLPSLSAMWAAAHQGLDLQPPLNAFVTHLVHKVAGAGPVATRLAPMLGYWTMSVLILVIVSKRSNATLGLAGALVPSFTAAYRYGYEARGYGLMMGLAALALYAWTEAARDRLRWLHLPVLAVALAAGLWNQYYGALVFVPLGVGELVRLTFRRKPDWPMWAAFAASLLGALPLVGLARVAAAQSSTYWAPARPGDIGPAYDFLFAPLIAPPFPMAAGVILFFVLLGLVTRRGRPWLTSEIPAHEVAAGLIWLLIPAGGVLLGMFVTGAFVPRYVLAAVVGLSITIPLIVSALSRGPGLADVVLLAVLAVPFAQSAYQSIVTARPLFRDPVADRALLLNRLGGDQPVVASGNVSYLQLWYYTPRELQSRLLYLADPVAARRYTGSDTLDLGYQVLAHYAPVPVQDYDAFVRTHRAFCVYAAGSGWLLERLREGGAVTEVGREPGAVVYEVRLR